MNSLLTNKAEQTTHTQHGWISNTILLNKGSKTKRYELYYPTYIKVQKCRNENTLIVARVGDNQKCWLSDVAGGIFSGVTLFSNSILVMGVDDDGYKSLGIYQNAQICIAWWVNPTISKLRKTHNKAFLRIYRLSGKPPLTSKFVILPMLACNGASSKLRNHSLITLSKFFKVSKTKFEFSLSDAFQSAEDNCLAKHIVKNKSKIFCLKYQNCYFNLPTLFIKPRPHEN